MGLHDKSWVDERLEDPEFRRVYEEEKVKEEAEAARVVIPPIDGIMEIVDNSGDAEITCIYCKDIRSLEQGRKPCELAVTFRTTDGRVWCGLHSACAEKMTPRRHACSMSAVTMSQKGTSSETSGTMPRAKKSSS